MEKQIVDINDTIKFKINKQILDLDKTFSCGQCFRWDKVRDYWYGVVDGKLFFLRSIYENGEQYIETTASRTEWENILYDYLDLNTEYNVNIPVEDKFAYKAKQFGEGIRILKQDTWETMVSFIISQRNNIPRIRSTIEKLCNTYGDKLDIVDSKGNRYNKEFYRFPSAERIAQLNISNMLNLGLGYRSDYIIKLAKAVVSGDINISRLKSLTDTSVISELLSITGVGPKVANCIALFGLHRMNMFPIDIWIQRVIDTYYNGNINIENYKPLSGLIQQYMFYYIKYSDVIQI